MIDKYKAWDPDFKEFLDVKAIIYDPKTLLHNGDELFDDGYIIDEHNDCHLFKDIKLIKYTGMKDLYDEPLYERDYIYREGRRDEIYEIIYSNSKAAYIAYPINENSFSSAILLYKSCKWVKVGNCFEGLNKEYKSKCKYCNYKAEYIYNNKNLCEDHLIHELLYKGDLLEVETISYYDKDCYFLGDNKDGPSIKDIVDRFNIERINDKNEK